MKNSSKISMLLILTMIFVFAANLICVFAAPGDFVMERRVVNGYENNQYTYNSSCTKTINCNASYDFSNMPSNYFGITLHNTLYVQVYEQYTNWFGTLKWREYGSSYQCNYSNYNFSLSQSVSLAAGTYGFQIYRPLDDYYYNNDLDIIAYVKISGNVKFQ